MITTLLGATGKLGAMLAHFANQANAGWQTQARQGPADVIWSGDFDDPAAHRIFREGATIINMIGHTGPDIDTLHFANVTFVQRLLARARDAGVAHVILASSASVYGAGDGTPFSEHAPPDPMTAYGASKAAMEEAALSFARAVATPAITILRICNVGGADALTRAAHRSVTNNAPMALHRFSDGTAPMRSYIGPQDLFDAVRAAALPFAGSPRVLNVAHPQALTLDAVLIAYRAHLFATLDWADGPVPEGVPQSITLRTEQLRQLIDFPYYNDPADAMARQIAKVFSI